MLTLQQRWRQRLNRQHQRHGRRFKSRQHRLLRRGNHVKNGWLSLLSNAQWYVDSINFLPNHGRGYTLAIYSEGNPLQVGINKVEQVARLVQNMLG